VYLWQVAVGLGVVLSALVKSQPPAVLLAIIARRCRWRSGEAWPSVVTRGVSNQVAFTSASAPLELSG